VVDLTFQPYVPIPDEDSNDILTHIIFGRRDTAGPDPVFLRPNLGTPLTRGYTVATLPPGTIGMRAYVTDATAPAYNAALVGGGVVTVPVFYNGAAWVSA
jgi:hypothetical protein